LNLRRKTETTRPVPHSRRHAGDGNAGGTAPTVLGQMEACIPSLRRYAVALLRDRDAADELVRECLVRALDMLHARRDDADVRTWLFTTMHHLCVTRMRRRRNGPPREDHEAAHNQFPSQEDGLQRPDLLRGLDRLSDEQRGALLLVTVEDFSYAEAATVLGMPSGMMMSCLARGRERLRQFTNTDARPVLREV
jgi:RNA polymerase sigma-70 factor (ECF subfamily)